MPNLLLFVLCVQSYIHDTCIAWMHSCIKPARFAAMAQSSKLPATSSSWNCRRFVFFSVMSALPFLQKTHAFDNFLNIFVTCRVFCVLYDIAIDLINIGIIAKERKLIYMIYRIIYMIASKTTFNLFVKWATVHVVDGYCRDVMWWSTYVFVGAPAPVLCVPHVVAQADIPYDTIPTLW